MQQNWKFQRGDIFFTHFGASTGSEQCGDRPAVILQNDVGNYHSPTLIVATMTSKAEKKVNQPTHCLLENAGLNMPSVVQAEQIFTIDKSRALKYLASDPGGDAPGGRCSAYQPCAEPYGQHPADGAYPALYGGLCAA